MASIFDDADALALTPEQDFAQMLKRRQSGHSLVQGRQKQVLAARAQLHREQVDAQRFENSDLRLEMDRIKIQADLAKERMMAMQQIRRDTESVQALKEVSSFNSRNLPEYRAKVADLLIRFPTAREDTTFQGFVKSQVDEGMAVQALQEARTTAYQEAATKYAADNGVDIMMKTDGTPDIAGMNKTKFELNKQRVIEGDAGADPSLKIQKQVTGPDGSVSITRELPAVPMATVTTDKMDDEGNTTSIATKVPIEQAPMTGADFLNNLLPKKK